MGFFSRERPKWRSRRGRSASERAISASNSAFGSDFSGAAGSEQRVAQSRSPAQLGPEGRMYIIRESIMPMLQLTQDEKPMIWQPFKRLATDFHL